MRNALLPTFVVALGLLTTTSCTSVGRAGPESRPESRPEPASDVSTENRERWDRLESIARARADSARRNVHDADVEFMQGMIHHHAQAVVMSRMAPSAGASPSVLTLTGRILNAQRDEIALMQQWLRDRAQTVPEVDDEGRMAAMDDASMHMHMHMPGMLSPAQLDELSRARGSDYDRLFLTFMIQHHEGAVTMVDDLFAIDGIVLTLDEDGSAEVTLPFSFPFQGSSYDSVFVNANGNLTFGAGDAEWFPTVPAFLDGPPRIAPLWDDLSPQVAGLVYVSADATSATVNYENVPEFFYGGSNTFSVTLYEDGTVEMNYGNIDAPDNIVGVTEGNGAADPGPSDLSTSPTWPASGTTYEEFPLQAPNDLAGSTITFEP